MKRASRRKARIGSEKTDVNATTAIMHMPRVIALAVGRGMETMLGFERLGQLPTRFLTGQFVAARAVRR